MWQMAFVTSSSKDTGHQQVFRMRYATQRMAALGMLLPKRVAGGPGFTQDLLVDQNVEPWQMHFSWEKATLSHGRGK
jgi:hypothetical protein